MVKTHEGFHRGDEKVYPDVEFVAGRGGHQGQQGQGGRVKVQRAGREAGGRGLSEVGAPVEGEWSR